MVPPPDTRKLERDVLDRPRPRETTLSRQLQRTETRSRILTLIRNGADAEQVCDLLAEGTPPVQATPEEITKIVKRYLHRIHTEDALTIEELRVLENQRLDRLWSQLMANSRDADGKPNLKVIDRLTRLSERRSKMNGTEGAQRHEHVVFNGLAAMGIDEELLEAGRQRWLESGADADPAEDIVDAELVDS